MLLYLSIFLGEAQKIEHFENLKNFQFFEKFEKGFSQENLKILCNWVGHSPLYIHISVRSPIE